MKRSILNGLLGAFVTVSVLMLFGIVGRSDRDYYTCRNQDNTTTPTFDQCVANQHELNSDR